MNQKVDQLERVTKSKYFIFIKLVLGKNEKLQENQTSCSQVEEVLKCLMHKKSGELFSI